VGLDGRVTAVDILPRVNTRESHGTSPESESYVAHYDDAVSAVDVDT